jgi:hypothetical protein
MDKKQFVWQGDIVRIGEGFPIETMLIVSSDQQILTKDVILGIKLMRSANGIPVNQNFSMKNFDLIPVKKEVITQKMDTSVELDKMIEILLKVSEHHSVGSL